MAGDIGAKLITNTTLGVPYYKYSNNGPQNPVLTIKATIFPSMEGSSLNQGVGLYMSLSLQTCIATVTFHANCRASPKRRWLRWLRSLSVALGRLQAGLCGGRELGVRCFGLFRFPGVDVTWQVPAYPFKQKGGMSPVCRQGRIQEKCSQDGMSCLGCPFEAHHSLAV